MNAGEFKKAQQWVDQENGVLIARHDGLEFLFKANEPAVVRLLNENERVEVHICEL